MEEKFYKIGKNARFAVVGHGSWATAIMKILLENEPSVGWYVGRAEVARDLRSTGRNPRYLTDVKFDSGRIDVGEDINETVAGADVVILCVPSAFITDVLAGLTVPLAGKFIVSAIKGIIPGDYLTVAEYLNRNYGLPFDSIGIVTGPCHSEEVALERLSYLTIVGKDPGNAAALCKRFTTGYIHANPSTDIYGAEYAAVLKNIYAIGAGIAVGLGYGDNFLAGLISNAATEMNRFLTESYPAPRDVTRSAYLGDLLVTCYSQFSRNRNFGSLIGKGYGIQAAMAGMKMVAEGYYAAKCIMQVNRRFRIHMPIAECVYSILHDNAGPAAEMKKMAACLQ
ncbi:MAG: NAD(P)-binding domain-containing protein [Rikenellaceae bacterium]|nr:NAD(P)-binding domain-containing protein [Rikenellaceae bacterium]